MALTGHDGVLGVDLDGEGPRSFASTTWPRVPDVVEALVAAGARVTRVEPFTTHARGSLLRRPGPETPTPTITRRANELVPRVKTIARTDLRQLAQARDFWGPMVILGSVFFVFVPLVLLLAITRVGDIQAVQQVSQALDLLPQQAQEAIRGTSDSARTSYALAVYLFAPVAVVVPLTIATAVGATTIVGERERGTGEFLAHSPAALEEIYVGKLIASLIPGYLTTVVGFGLYSLIVNLVVGPKVGGWFFPTSSWWVLMIWVVPPFLALTLAIVLRFSARVKSSAAAQQAAGLVSLPMIIIAYSQSTGALFGASRVGLHRRVARVDRGPDRSQSRHAIDDPSPPPRRRRRSLTSPSRYSSRERVIGDAKLEREAGASGLGGFHGVDQLGRAAGTSGRRRRGARTGRRPRRRSRTPSGGRSRAGRGCRTPRPPSCRCRRAAGTRSRHAWHEKPSWLSTPCGLIASICAPTSLNSPMSSVYALSCFVHTGVLSPG